MVLVGLDHWRHKDAVAVVHLPPMLEAYQHGVGNLLVRSVVVDRSHVWEDRTDNHLEAGIVAAVVVDSQGNGNAVAVVVDRHLCIGLVVVVEALAVVEFVAVQAD